MNIRGKKIVHYNGLRFCRDDETGYYRNSNNRLLLHRYIYETKLGPIPSGHEVHHKDTDKSNNKTDNLEIILSNIHKKLHGSLWTKERRQIARDNLTKNARPAANIWHGSDNGREWHKKHYEATKEALHKKVERECLNCDKKYLTSRLKGNTFCSNKCKSAWRRAKGLDNIIKTCLWCDFEFETNKYRESETCSRSCANRVRAYRKRQSTGA